VSAFVQEYIYINGIRQYFLHYPVPEADNVVLFLHGGPGNSIAHYLYAILPKSRKYHFVCYDQRGCGKTQIANHSRACSLSLEVLLEDLRQSIEYLKIKYNFARIVLMGHSWGSLLGLEYIKHYPKSVCAYVGIAQVVCFQESEKIAYRHNMELLQNISDKKHQSKILKALKRLEGYPEILSDTNAYRLIAKFRALQAKIGSIGLKDSNAKGLFAVMKHSPVFSWRDVLVALGAWRVNRHLVATLAQYDTRNFLDFEVPMYFVLGGQDYQGVSAVAQQYFENINAPYKQCYVLENARDLLALEGTELFSKIVWEIIESKATSDNIESK